MNRSHQAAGARRRGRPLARLAVALPLGAAVLAAQALATAPGAQAAPTTITFASTGQEQVYPIPPGTTALTITAVGAPGGNIGGTFGGNGAVVTATVPMTALPAGTTTLYVEVGGPGASYTPASCDSSGLAGGFNGGASTNPLEGCAGGGGGASDVRTTSIATVADSALTPANDSRLVVAGGGGGAGTDLSGTGGNTTGGTAGDTTVTGPGNGGSTNIPAGDSSPGGDGGSGGTQGGNGGGVNGQPPPASTDGSLGQGGTPYIGGGGGGGGYYGGGAGGWDGVDNISEGGGAGSSFWVPAATSTSMSEDNTGIPEVQITPVMSLPSVTTTSLPGGQVGSDYGQQQLVGTGGFAPYTWSVANGSLPPGLSLNSSTGVISGTPTTAGNYAFTVQVADSENPPVTAVSQPLTITVASASQSISFTTPATGTVAGSATLTATGGGSGNPVVFTVDPSSGSGVCTVSGTNGTNGTYTATVTYTAAGSCVIDANQAGNASYTAAQQVQQTITVNQAPAFVIGSPPLTAVTGQAYDYTFEASGTPAPSYALASGAPSWLSVNPATGEVTGTPPAGTTSFSYAVTATNVVGTATAGPFTVTVTKPSANADISATLTCPASMTVGGTGTCTLTVANAGPATATKVVAGVALPAALSETSCTSACARHANVFTWTLTSLASGASAKFTITIKADAKGKVLMLAAAASQNPDPEPLNNISTQQITITG
jgi:uncharacterized repeat protein (TIGR01451 family)